MKFRIKWALLAHILNNSVKSDHVACPAGDLGITSTANDCFGSLTIVSNFDIFFPHAATTSTYGFVANNKLLGTSPLPIQNTDPIYKGEEIKDQEPPFDCYGYQMVQGCALNFDTKTKAVTNVPHVCTVTHIAGNEFPIFVNGKFEDSKLYPLKCWCQYSQAECDYGHVTLSNPSSGVSLVNPNSHQTVGISVDQSIGIQQTFNFNLVMSGGLPMAFTGKVTSDTAFTLSYTGSDPRCGDTDRQNLYSDAAGNSLFTSTQFYLDKSIPALQNKYPIKINIATPTSAPVIFYFIEKSAGGAAVSQPVQYDIMICGGELVQPTAGIQQYIFPVEVGSTGKIISVVDLKAFFTLSNITPTSRCPLEDITLSQDSSGTPWADTAKALLDTSVTTDAPFYPLKIHNSASYPVTNLFLKAKSKGNILGYKQLQIQCCQIFSSVTVSGDYNVVESKALTSVDIAAASSWFIYSPAPTPDMCSSQFQITTDPAGLISTSVGPLIIDLTSSPDQSGLQQVQIDRNVAAGTYTRYLSINYPQSINGLTINYNKVQKTVNIEICDETILLVNSKPQTFLFNSPPQSGKFVISAATQNTWFTLQNQGVNCGYQQTRLVTDQASPQAWTNSQIQQDSAQLTIFKDILIEAIPLNYTLFLEVESKTKKQYQQIDIEVCGYSSVIQPSEEPLIKVKSSDKNGTNQVVYETSFFQPYSEQCAWSTNSNATTFECIEENTNAWKIIPGDFKMIFSQPLMSSKQILQKQIEMKVECSIKYRVKALDSMSKEHLKNFKFVQCLDEVLSFNQSLYTFTFRSSQGNNEIINYSSWLSNTIPECNVTFELKQFDLDEILNVDEMTNDNSTAQIKVKANQNYFMKFSLHATSFGGAKASTGINVYVCGDETIIKPTQGTIQNTYSQYQSTSQSKKNVMVIYESLRRVFYSNDINCQVQSYNLIHNSETSQSDDIIKIRQYQIAGSLTQSLIPQNNYDYSLEISTEFPGSYSFKLEARTIFKSQQVPVSIRICGNEKVSVNGNGFITYKYDKQTTLTKLGKEKYQELFEVRPIYCIITRYSVTNSKTIPGTQILGKSIFINQETDDIFIDFKQQYKDQKIITSSFYIEAMTESGKKNYLKVDLIKQSCEFESMFMAKDSIISRLYNQDSKFLIKRKNYSQFFRPSNPSLCPVINTYLTLKPLNENLLQKIPNVGEIDTLGNVYINFDKMIISGKSKTIFFITGFDEAENWGSIKVILLRQGFTDVFNFQQYIDNLRGGNYNFTGEALAVRVTRVSNQGNATIRFSHILTQPRFINLTKINESVFNLNVVRIKDGQFIKFYWVATEMREREIDINLYFEKPFEVSDSFNLLGLNDKLVVIVKDENFFIGRGNRGQPIYVNNFTRVAYSNVDKQLLNEQLSQTLVKYAKIIKDGMMTSLIVTLLLDFVFAAALQLFIEAFEILQIIIFQTMINVQYPANAQFLASQVMNILNVDVLNPEYAYDVLNFDFDPEYDLIQTLEKVEPDYRFSIIQQIQAIGFETYNPILNIGGLFVCNIIVLFQFFCYAFTRIVIQYVLKSNKKNQKEGGQNERESNKQQCKRYLNHICVRWSKSLKRNLFYTIPITIMQESIIQLTVSYLLLFMIPRRLMDEENQWNTTSGLSFFYGYLSLFLMIYIHCVNFLIMINETSNLEHHVIRRKYGFLYNKVKTDSTVCLAYSLLFAIRRTACAYIYIFCNNFPFFQLASIQGINTFFMLYIAKVKPFQRRHNNRKELYQEFIIIIITDIYFLFTNFVPDETIKYTIAGWMYITVLGFVLLVITAEILHEILRSTWLYILKYYNYYLKKQVDRIRNKCFNNLKNQFKSRIRKNESEEDIPILIAANNTNMTQEQIQYFVEKMGGQISQDTIRIDKVKLVKSLEDDLFELKEDVYYNKRKLKILQTLFDITKNQVTIQRMGMLYDEEKVKLILIILTAQDFLKSFEQYVLKMLEKYNQDKLWEGKPEINLNQFMKDHRKFVCESFKQQIKEFIESEKFQDKTDEKYPTFKEFSDKHFDLQKLIQQYFILNEDEDVILKPNVSIIPAKEYFYKLKYDPKIIEKCLKLGKLIKIDTKLNFLSKKELKWLSLQKREERKRYFRNNINEHSQIDEFYRIASDCFIQKKKDIKIQENALKKEINDFLSKSDSFGMDIKYQIIVFLLKCSNQGQRIEIKSSNY